MKMRVAIAAQIMLLLEGSAESSRENATLNKETRTLSHFSESASSENFIFPQKSRIRPADPPPEAVKTKTAEDAVAAGGNRSNYPTNAGDSKRLDLNSFLTDFSEIVLRNETGDNRIRGESKILGDADTITAQKLITEDCGETNPVVKIFGSRLDIAEDEGGENITILIEQNNVTYKNFDNDKTKIVDLKTDSIKNKMNTDDAAESVITNGSSVENAIVMKEFENNTNSSVSLKLKLISKIMNTISSASVNDFIADHTTNHKTNNTMEEIINVNSTTNEDYNAIIWQEIDNITPKIKFSDFPHSDSYLTPSLRLQEGPFPFKFVSGLFSSIFPGNPPVDTLQGIAAINFDVSDGTFENLQLDWRILACGGTLACVALIMTFYMICSTASGLCRRDVVVEASEKGLGCRGRLQIAQLLVLMSACGVCVLGMAVSSEKASWATATSARALGCGGGDVTAWAKSVARDLRHAVALPADLMLAHYKQDLANVEQLLGEPIQRAISSESGVELVLDSISDITTESNDLSRKVSTLRELCFKASKMVVTTSDRLTELARQLDAVKKECGGRDARLCDTINTKALEINLKFDVVLKEQHLLKLRALGADNLTQAAEAARTLLQVLPAHIAKQTQSSREMIQLNLERRCNIIRDSARVLDDMVRHLSAQIRTGSAHLEASLAAFEEFDDWRWTLMLGCMVGCALVVILATCGLLCSCWNYCRMAKRTIQLSAYWMAVVSLFVWSFTIVIFVISSHAEVNVCRALWDRPEYEGLSNLLDRRPAVDGTPSEGFLDSLFDQLDNVTVDVPVHDVIRECEQDRPAYIVFRMDRVFDINRFTAFFEWKELDRSITALSTSVEVVNLKEMSSNLSKTLQDMLVVSKVDMASYRKQYNGPLVGKDLNSLAEQLENIATQLTDLSVSSRIETLVTRIRRLLSTSIDPLEHLRSELVYKLTELELQLAPFHRQLNTSLSHIRTMQYYVDNQGAVIAQKKVLAYASRLVSHVSGWRSHAVSAATTRAGRCRPLYDVFNAARTLVCSHYISSLHGFWLCGACCMVLWCYAVPCCLRLSDRLRDPPPRRAGSGVLLTRNDSVQHELASIESIDNWNIPAPPPPQENW